MSRKVRGLAVAINREQGLGVAQCASSAGVDDLVPVKRSFVDAARSSRLPPHWEQGRPSSAAPAGGGGGGGRGGRVPILFRQCSATSNHCTAPLHSNELDQNALDWTFSDEQYM